MKTLKSNLENKADKEELRKFKIRPLSFLVGVGFGLVDGEFDQQDQGGELIKLLSQDPSLLQYGVVGGVLSAIIYLDNLVGGRTKENAGHNTGICFMNYTVGYGLGYFFSKSL